MAKRKQGSQTPPLRRPLTEHYEVGFGKPPKDTRFKSGRSGNPKGRPKGSKNRLPALNEERMKSIILKEAYRTITVMDGGRPVSLSMVEAIVRSLALSAAKGQQRAQRLFTDLLYVTEQANKALQDTWLETAIEYKVDWDRELERRRRLGIVATDPVPHPDDIIIDFNAGKVRIQGPMTKEEKVVWDQLRRRKHACDSQIADFQTMLEGEPDPRMRQIILDDIEQEKRLRATISKLIVD